MRREELAGWLEEVARQLRTGTLMIDGEKVAVPKKLSSRIKAKNKKGQGSLKLKLEWETKLSKEKKKAREIVPADGQKTKQRNETRPAAMVRDHDSHVLVCTGDDCKKRGAQETRKALKGEIRASGMLGDVRVDTVDCLGLCKHGPNVVVYEGAQREGSWYLDLVKADVPEVVEQHLKRGAPVERLVADRRPRKVKKAKRRG